MPRKSTMRDNVNAVRSRLPHLSDLSREKIELALLYYESNIDETVTAFQRNGAIEALSGWTEMGNGRGNTSAKRTNNKPGNRNNKPFTLNTNSSLPVPPSNGILRPSQRVSNIFQTFAEGGTPSIITNGSATISSTTTCSPSSVSSSFIESPDNNLQLNSYLHHDSTPINDVIPNETTERRRNIIKNRNSSITENHEQPITTDNQQTLTKPSSSNSTVFHNNKKIFTKSVKDLQRQTSTLTNVELSFDNEIKSSIKRIDDIFKQIREIIKEREVELYLEMDKVKEQGLNIIHRRQQRAIELRQRIDRCDRLEPFEIDNLRTDIKQFVTDRRYDLGEELTSSHRFEYDQTLIESLKNFGHVLRIDRKHDRTRSMSTSSALVEANVTTTTTTAAEKAISDVTPENVQISMTNDRIPSVSSLSNEVFFTNNQQQQSPLPQRINNKQSNDGIIHNSTNEHVTGDYHQNFYSLSQTNGHYQHYENNYQNMNRRRPQQYSQGNFQRARPPVLYYQNGNNRRNVPKEINGRINIHNNSETTHTYRRPRPRPPSQPSHSIVPVQT